MYLWTILLVRQSEKRPEVSGKQTKSLQDWLKIWCWRYSGFKIFCLWVCSWIFFSGRGTLQDQGVESQLIQQWAPVTPYRKRLLFNKTIFCKCNFFNDDVIYLWLLFCLFFILISQSCENMLYDIVCLFYFRNHNFTLNGFCRIPVDFFVIL